MLKLFSIVYFIISQQEDKLPEAGLQVLNIDQDEFSKPIPISVANFGDTPYGRSIQVRLVYTSSTYCNAETSPEVEDDISGGYPYYILMGLNSTCSFAKQVANAQKVGASGAIFSMNKRFENADIKKIIMIDPVKDKDIIIPSLLIRYQDDQNLVKYYENSKKKFITVIITYPQLEKTKVVNYSIVFNPFLSNSIEFIKNWYSVFMLTRNDTKMTPYFDIKWVPGNHDNDFTKKVCILQGKYCELTDIQGITGKQAILEVLNQKCILKVTNYDTVVYMNFMMSFYNRCINMYTEDCWKSIITEVLVDYNIGGKSITLDTVTNCITNSYTHGSTEDNSVLKQELDQIKSMGIPILPAVFVNGKYVRGSMTRVDIFDEICESFITPPEYCNAIISDPNPEHWNVDIDTGRIIAEPQPEPLIPSQKNYFKIGVIAVVVIAMILLVIFALVYNFYFKDMLTETIEENINNYKQFNDEEDKENIQGNHDVDNWDG